MLEENLRFIFDKILSDFEKMEFKPQQAYMVHDEIPLKWYDMTSCSAGYSLCHVYELPDGTFKMIIDRGGVEHQGGPYIPMVDEVICLTIRDVYITLINERQWDGNTTTDVVEQLKRHLYPGVDPKKLSFRCIDYYTEDTKFLDILAEMKIEDLRAIFRMHRDDKRRDLDYPADFTAAAAACSDVEDEDDDE